jgi:uncharacterized membrane protein (DUF485 family)
MGHKDRLIDIPINFIKQSKIIVAFLLFCVILFLLTDFTTQYILAPLKSAELGKPTQRGYLIIALLLALSYLVIDFVYNLYVNRCKTKRPTQKKSKCAKKNKNNANNDEEVGIRDM